MMIKLAVPNGLVVGSKVRQEQGGQNLLIFPICLFESYHCMVSVTSFISFRDDSYYVSVIIYVYNLQPHCLRCFVLGNNSR